MLNKKDKFYLKMIKIKIMVHYDKNIFTNDFFNILPPLLFHTNFLIIKNKWDSPQMKNYFNKTPITNNNPMLILKPTPKRSKKSKPCFPNSSIPSTKMSWTNFITTKNSKDPFSKGEPLFHRSSLSTKMFSSF